MDSYEMELNVLARIIRTGNNEAITNAVEELKKFPAPINYSRLIDKANLPFLVDTHAPKNESAMRLIKDHRVAKQVEMAKETPFIVNDFYNSMQLEIDEVDEGNEDIGLGMEEDEDMGFHLEIDEYNELNLEEQDKDNGLSQKAQDDDADSVFSDQDAALMADESGSDSGFEEKEEDYKRKSWKYRIASFEVHVRVLSEMIKAGDPDQIAEIIEISSNVDLPLYAYRKYEITCLIAEYAIHSDEAINLWNKIDQMEDISLEKDYMKTFNYVIECVETQSTVPKSMMGVIADYLITKDQCQMDRVVNLLIEKEIPFEFFKEYRIKQYLLNIGRKDNAIWTLILKIRGLEYGE
uniref:BTB domain-containing protein n=1 Tax=Caenorhabditis tropicalis TaxID=1561998 RepID=A0A1I7UVH6_9PELO